MHLGHLGAEAERKSDLVLSSMIVTGIADINCGDHVPDVILRTSYSLTSLIL